MAERKHQHLALIAAVTLLALGSGCVTTDAKKTAEPKKPDVTQPGVLPPPQEMLKPASAVAPGGSVVHAGGTPPAPIAPTVAVTPPAVPPGPSALAKLTGRVEKKVPATEMAVAWGNRIAYLPDPTKNGAMGCGLAGQLFLYGGPTLQFAQADGVLTVDLIDETPRPAGQPAAKPERWQFDKNTLRKLQTHDETFGKSYVLFLPWPAYKADITRVRISARYDPENGHTLYAKPSAVSIDPSAPFGTPVWDGVTTVTPITPLGAPGAARPQPFGAGAVPSGGTNPAGGFAPMLSPVPIGGGPRFPPAPGTPGADAAAPTFPLAPSGTPGAALPAPNGSPLPEGLTPIAITISR